MADYQMLLLYYHHDLMFLARDTARFMMAKWRIRVDLDPINSVNGMFQDQMTMVSFVAGLPMTPRMELERKVIGAFNKVAKRFAVHGWSPVLRNFHNYDEALEVLRRYTKARSYDMPELMETLLTYLEIEREAIEALWGDGLEMLAGSIREEIDTLGDLKSICMDVLGGRRFASFNLLVINNKWRGAVAFLADLVAVIDHEAGEEYLSADDAMKCLQYCALMAAALGGPRDVLELAKAMITDGSVDWPFVPPSNMRDCQFAGVNKFIELYVNRAGDTYY